MTPAYPQLVACPLLALATREDGTSKLTRAQSRRCLTFTTLRRTRLRLRSKISGSLKLLRRQISGYCNYAPINPQLVMAWSTYSAKSVARIQAAGMPIDMPLWDLVQENKAAVVSALIARFDPSQGSEYPIYFPQGEFSSWRFEQWLISAGIIEWPRLESGALQLDGDAFRMMCHAHQAIEGLHVRGLRRPA